MKKTNKLAVSKTDKKITTKRYFNRGNTNNNFQQLKKLHIHKKDPDCDSSIHNMNITQLKKFAIAKGIINNDLKKADREDLINLIEWPNKISKIPNINLNDNLNSEEQLRLISAHVKKLNSQFENLLSENSQLKELLGEYQFKHNRQTSKFYTWSLWALIVLLMLLLVIVFITKK